MSPQHRHLQHYADRRFKAFERMGAQSACLVPSSKTIIRNGDAHYPFRQDSYLHYLSGWPEDNTLLLLVCVDQKQKAIIFCQESSDFEKRWVGERIGPQKAVAEFGFDEAYAFEEIAELLPELLKGCEKLYYPLDPQHVAGSYVHSALNVMSRMKRAGWQVPTNHIDLSYLLDELRLFKMGDEMARMRKAASISAKAHIRAMLHARADMFEYELEAEYNYEFLKHGAHDVAYTSIVAGGKNACVLHYIKNNQKIKDGDLVLVDAGCEYQGYASDITRTFPINGVFTEPQKAVYNIVLEAQLAAINVAKAGEPWNRMQAVILEVMVAGLIELGVLEGEVKALVEQEAYKPYYMHNSGHWLGLDVHDVGDYKVDKLWRTLKPGMVLTIEPGLYFPQEDHTIPEALRGIGIRIEDDVLITDGEPDILSKEVPKTIAEIEALMMTKL